MSYDFCTLFDRNYLFKGLALYESLEQHAGDFTLWILCMDDVVYETLEKMALSHARPIRMSDFEDERLLEVKPTRSAGEYCWTCTPSLPLYLLEHHPDIELVTYIDADLFFFNDPGPAFAEMEHASIGIMEHRYSARWSHMAADSGVYVVQFMSFRNDERALEALSWWRERCIEWCYHRIEDGKMGDQRYVDDWLERFQRVIVYQHKGAGLAPWNFERYQLSLRGGAVFVDDVPLIFYHFHSFEIHDDDAHFTAAYDEYKVRRRLKHLVYEPYVGAIKRAIALTRQTDPDYSFGITTASHRATAARAWAQRRSKASRLLQKVPPLWRAWQVVKRAIRPADAPLALSEGDVSGSWKADGIAAKQQALVETQLQDAEAVPPFRTFLEIMRYIDGCESSDSRSLLDIGCGVGHYSELLRRYFPGKYRYTGSDYSDSMIARARALWPDIEFVVDDIFESRLDLSKYDILMASALVDVLEDFWTVLDLLFDKTEHLLILHRQRLTERPSYSVKAPGYEGQTTYATHLNLSELEERLANHGLRIGATFIVDEGLHSFLIERVARSEVGSDLQRAGARA